MPALKSTLEDELGDVLEKALRLSGLTLDALAERSGVDRSKLADAVDYRYDLSAKELCAVAVSLKLNEVGLCAIGTGQYPLPLIGELPFSLRTLKMSFGSGSVNAYAAVSLESDRGILFDGGTDFSELQQAWPRGLLALDAAFLTHAETEHLGGISAVLEAYSLDSYFGPKCRQCHRCGELKEGEEKRIGVFSVLALRTPGHAAEHNSYYVRLAEPPRSRGVLIAGDLIFAGSLGGGYFSGKTLVEQARRVLAMLPGDTVIAPGHGPLTTVAHEQKYNPFIV